MEAGLAKVVLEGRVAIFMEAGVAIGAIEEGVVLLKVGTETPPT